MLTVEYLSYIYVTFLMFHEAVTMSILLTSLYMVSVITNNLLDQTTF